MTKIDSRFTLIGLSLLLLSFSAPSSRAQGHHGIPSDGKDFFIGYMPGIKHSGTTWSGVTETYYVLIGSYSDNNLTSVSYFDATTGLETSGPQMPLQKGRIWKYRIDVSHMTPSRPGEVAQWCAAHIRSQFPVSVQCYSEGSSAGGLLQAIPTPALGKNYVVASWFDNPIQNNPGYLNRDSASGEFMIVAPFDSTSVTFTPASTTNAGIVGVHSGIGSNGTPHPKTILLQRGQVYWVRSLSIDPSFDISGSTVSADKPIAVLAGHERALLGDPSGIWHSIDNDVRNIMFQQMTPVEDWDTEYVSIPLVPPPAVERLLVNGTGQMYRVYTASGNGGLVDAMIGGSVNPQTSSLASFQNPIPAYPNIVDPVDLRNRDGMKMNVVQYEYFQGQHDIDPGQKVGKGENGGMSTLSGGGPTLQDETTYKMPSEMNVVPVSRWKKNAVWQVPTGSNYRGYQWINVLTSKDSANTIQLSFNGATPKPLLLFPVLGPFRIPLHPELIGYQLQLPAGDYSMSSPNTSFVVYSYGRTQTQYKDGWGYASSCGQSYGTRDEPNPPRTSDTAACASWSIKIFDSRPTDEGIAEIELLNDPQGVYERPARVSYNMSLNPVTPDFVVGDSVVNFQLVVTNPLKNAYGAVYAVDRAGNDTVFEFEYTPPLFTTNTNSSKDSLLGAMVGTDSCTTVVLKYANEASTITIDRVALSSLDSTFRLLSTIPALPAILHTGDSLIANVCYEPSDTGLIEKNSILFISSCSVDTIPIIGMGATPIIVATDVDFGTVQVGSKVCKNVTISNIGNAPLRLTKDWIIHDTLHFAIEDSAQFPLTILPLQSVHLNICYTPTEFHQDSTTTDWATNIGGRFIHQKKDYSFLIGNRGIAAVKRNPNPTQNAVTFELNPNPASSTVTLQIGSIRTGLANIAIYELLGSKKKEVRAAIHEGSNRIAIDLSSLPAGRYFIRLDLGADVATKPLTVLR